MECIYCTPEWLSESARLYRENTKLQESLRKLTAKVFLRIKAEPAWGIDTDYVFGGFVTKGALDELRFFSEKEVQEQGELVMAATPQEWKVLLRKEHKFLTDFMLGKVKLEKGTIAAALGVAPYADGFIDTLNQVNLVFQDELSPEKLGEYRQYATQFRAKLGL